MSHKWHLSDVALLTSSSKGLVSLLSHGLLYQGLNWAYKGYTNNLSWRCVTTSPNHTLVTADTRPDSCQAQKVTQP
eukprot:1148706-Pelagomonas_calceolata.AAC.2